VNERAKLRLHTRIEIESDHDQPRVDKVGWYAPHSVEAVPSTIRSISNSAAS
jgi:hypothetical protein